MVKVLRVWQYRAVLEPDDGKLSSPVLRGGGGGDASLFTRQVAFVVSLTTVSFNLLSKMRQYQTNPDVNNIHLDME